VSGLLLEHLGDQVLGFQRDYVPIVRVKVQFLLQDAFEYLFVIVAFKWWIAAEHDIKDDSHAPDVASKIIVAFEHFWRHIVGSSHYGMHLLLWV
jgi:hypothetical protein